MNQSNEMLEETRNRFGEGSEPYGKPQFESVKEQGKEESEEWKLASGLGRLRGRPEPLKQVP